MPAEGGGRAGTQGFGAAANRLLSPLALILIAVLVFWWWYFLAVQASPGDWAFDFRQFWQGGNDVVNGVSPYPSSDLLATARDDITPEGIREVFRFPYPAGAAVLLAPLGALEFHAAAAVWSALLIAALVGALLILRVGDWRVFAVVVTAAPVITSVRLGSLTPVLVLLLAVAWRWRERQWVAGGSIAAAIALKVFLWPVVVWFLATRRYAAAAVSAAGAALLTFGAWAAIGFAGLTEYADLVRRLTEIVAPRGFSLVALGVEAGLPRGVADALPWVAGVALLVCVVLSARREDGDRVPFALTVGACLAFTPIVWLHYFALLIVPVAVFRPRFAWVWLLFWVFWLTPNQTNDGDLWRILVVDGTAAALLVWLLYKDEGRVTA
jgi:hypothetical protein